MVYFRNTTGNPLTNFSDLAQRWGISKATVSRILNKLQDKEYLSLVSFTGRHGNVIYLCSYLSAMFNISDVMIDKEEISITFQVPVHIPDDLPLTETETIRDEQITIMEAEGCVSGQAGCVSQPYMKNVVQKVAQILATQGVSCCECPWTQYKLYPLSDCKEIDLRYSLQIVCPNGKMPYRFELTLTPVIPSEDSNYHAPINQTDTKNEVKKVNTIANTRPNKNILSEQENPLFHDTWKLLKNYRDAVWNLELAVQQVRSTFEIKYGNSIEEFLDSIYLAGADIGGTRLEDYAKSIEHSNKMVTL